MTPKMKKGLLILGLLAALVGGTAASCDGGTQGDNSDKMMEARNKKVAGVVLCGNEGQSNTCKNLAEHVKRNEDPNRLTYIYLMNIQGEPYAYWVAKGPVTSTQAQMLPTDQVLDIDPVGGASYRQWAIMEGPGDDGSSGPALPGLFFYDEFGSEVEIYNVSVILSDGPFNLPGVKKLVVQK